MKTSLLYNTEILVKLLACLGAWHYLGFGGKNDEAFFSILLPPIGTSLLYNQMTFGGIKNDVVLLESTVILSFVADGIFRAVRFLVCRLLKGELLSQSSISLLNRPTAIALLVWSLMYLITCFLFGLKSWIQPEVVVGVALILMVLYLAFLSISLLPNDVPLRYQPAWDREVNFVVWMILLLPFIAVGDLYAVWKGLQSWVHCKVLILLSLRFALATHVFSPPIATPNPHKVDMELYRTMMRKLRVVTMGFGCWNLFALHVHGEILLHPLPALVMTATICDIVEFIIEVRSV
jgi:hypothetical protein